MAHKSSKHPIASVDRIARINGLLKCVIADLIEKLGLNEHGRIISVTRVVCSVNLKNADVYVSILNTGGEEEEQQIVRNLIARKSEFQTLLAREVILKYTPVLHFISDHSVAEGDRILDLLRQMETEENETNGKM